MIMDLSQNGLKVTIEVGDDGSVALKEFSRIGDADNRKKISCWCPLAEVHLCGENQDDHGARHTGSVGARLLRYKTHNLTETADGQLAEILLSDGRMNVTVHYQFYKKIAAIRAWTTIQNIGVESIGLEYVSSFTYTGLDGGNGYTDNDLKIYIPHNGWTREVNWQEYSPFDLGLERWDKFSQKNTSTKRVSISNTGTMSTKEYLPMGAVLNCKRNTVWMFQIENNGSWNWEISDVEENMLYLKLSGPSEQENKWFKWLAPGEDFESVKTCVVVGENLNDTLEQMTRYRRKIFHNNYTNAKLPVIFNDYMNCLWAEPTEERELPIIDRAAEMGAEYFCMDAGWYATGSWWDTVGEWQPAAHRFPHGIKYVFDYIRKKGMIPGIWLEIEVMGIKCPLAKEWEDECFFIRHGKRVISHGRYQLDFRNLKVRDYATAVVDRVVCDYGVRYIKMDYNIDSGSGTEVNADSFGDGLLQHNRAYLSWVREIMKRYPDLIWECCSSGGMRMDYAMLSVGHLQSVSDQWNCFRNIPIAATAPTAVLPEQGAIWSYPVADADERVTTLNMINAMLGRIHLSGAVTEISEHCFKLMKEAVVIYKSYRNELPTAIPFYPFGLPNYHDQFFCLALRFFNCIRMAVWRTDTDQEQVTIPLEKNYHNVTILYPFNSGCIIEQENERFTVKFQNQYQAVLLEIR